MKFFLSVVLVICALPAQASVAGMGGAPLTFELVMALAASAAPDVRVASTLVAEGEAKLAGAKVRTLENPQLELETGPRSADEDSVDFGVGLEIPVELWGRRDKRIAFAEAELQRERMLIDEARRQAISVAVGAYFQVIHARHRFELACERKALAEELQRIATERYRSGDASLFEVNLAKTEIARAASEIAATQGSLAQVRATLEQSLGFPAGSNFHVEGNLDDRSFFDRFYAEPGIEQRADLLAARADVEASKAGVDLAKAELRPDVALRLIYHEEGDEKVALAGVAVDLPFLNPRSEASVQEAMARSQRARIVAEVKEAAISSQIEGARRAYESAVVAVRRMEEDAIPLQRENESMATESYRSGKIGLADLLQVRRESLDTRREYLDQLLKASEAGIELASAIGAFFK